MPIKTKVKVLNNRHPDVQAGTIGEVECHSEGGYGVEITGSWMYAGGDRGQRYSGTEIIWYEGHELEEVK